MFGPLREYVENLLRSLVPDGDLTRQTVRSGFWEVAINVSSRLMELLVLIVLARLLTPKDFGLIGIALLTIAALRRFSRPGIDQALIYSRDEDVDHYLNTVWTIQMVRGVLLAAIAFAFAPLVASFFGEPRVTDLIRFMALSPLLSALSNPATIYFVKDLQFHKKFVYKTSSSLAQFFVALGFALAYANVWALAFGFVGAKATQVIVSYRIHPFRPRLRFKSSFVRELIGYGKWITVSNMIYFLLDEGDDFVVGWLVSAAALGFYKMAYRVGNAPATEVTNVVGNVLFATFSKLQDDTERLRKMFLRTVQVTSLISFPMAVGLVVVAPVFVRGVLGEQWLPMVTTMQILALYGLLMSLTISFHKLWKAIGRPDYVTKIGFLRLVAMGLLVIPAASRYGIEGAALTILGTYVFVTLPLDVYLLRRSIGLTARDLFAESGYPLVASLLMGLIVLIARRSLDLGYASTKFLLLVTLGVSSYVLIVIAFDALLGLRIRRNLNVIIESFRT